MSHRAEIDLILKQATAWSDEERAELVQKLREVEGTKAAPARPSFARAYGIAKGEGSAPTDQDVKQWIDEHRMRKYG